MTELAAVANTSRKSYYIWLKKRQIKTQQEIENAKILAAIRQIEKRHLNCAGYRKVTAILNSDTSKIKEYTFSFDFPINIKRVRRIMREHGIKADIRQPRRNRVKEQQQYLEDNVLHRQFAPDQPNKIWVTDTTELTYGRGNKVRLHAIIDLYGNYALSYFISPTETAKDVIKAFELAKQKTSRLAPLIHTDRGSAYTSREFSNYLIQNQCVHSMSAPGTPADNAVIERWWCDFKHLWLAHQPAPQTYDQLLKLVAEGVKYFNTVEISGKRKNLTAVDYYRSEIA